LRIEDMTALLIAGRSAVRRAAAWANYSPRTSQMSSGSMNRFNQGTAKSALELREHNSLLVLILALAIGVADLAGFIGAKEQNLAQPFVGVNLGR